MGPRAESQMREAWESFAQTDPTFYVRTDRRNWDLDEFFESGEAEVEQALSWLGGAVPRRRMLDIGCGLGRTAIHFARHFDQVDGVDISETMIRRAESLSPPPNVRYSVTSGKDLRAFDDETFDFAYSLIVFQHIEDEDVIASYLREIRRVLREGGRAQVQFFTRRRRLVRTLLRRALPDRLLPTTRRPFIRRYARDPERVREMLTAAGLEIVDERDIGKWGRFFLLAPRPLES